MKIVILKFFLVNALMITVNHTVVYKNIVIFIDCT